jgi:alkylhydroperoxidase/carboxymuconolactone decarboxylase family protein YurZ
MADVPEAWISLVTQEEAEKRRPPDHPYNFEGVVGGMTRLLMTHPSIGPAFFGVFEQVMFAPGHLDRGEREMVAAVTSAAQDCFY